MKLFALAALALSLISLPAFAQAGDELSSGGLAPPAPVDAAPPPTAPTETEQALTRADREDSGRGLQFVWLEAEVGGQHLGLQTLHDGNLVDGELVPSTATGLSYGAGAGVRLLFITAGARFRFGSFEAWKLWTLNAEFGWRIPLGAFEPYLNVGGGYASLGGFDARGALGNAGFDAVELAARGFDIRAGAGFDYYVGPIVSVGANLSGEFLFLSRSALPTTGTGTDAALAAVYAQDGSSIGLAGTLTAVVGVHF